MSVVGLGDMVRQLREEGVGEHTGMDTGMDADAGLIDAISLLETLKSVASAVQARLTARFAASREVQLARLGTADVRDRARRDIGAQIGLARRVSPRIGSRQVGLAKVLTTEMPHLMTALTQGLIDEYQATVVVAETTTLSREHRRQVDAELAARYGTLTPMEARGAAASIGYRLDPEQAVRRHRRAYGERRVSLRPAPDSMTYLTALLPMVEGVAVYTALNQHAAAGIAAGDVRGRGALMADELFARLIRPSRHSGVQRETAGATGDVADGLPGAPAGVHVEIHLVMTDRALFDGDMEPAVIPGHGPIPAPLARHLISGADPTTRTWVRRMYTDPHSGQLTGSDSRRRLFTHAARQFLVARDQVCRTPWCSAPIRHADHVRPHAADGPTSITNGAGLCAACNQTKELPGWTSETADDGSILVRTPTGHRYLSRPPDPPRSAPWETRVA